MFSIKENVVAFVPQRADQTKLVLLFSRISFEDFSMTLSFFILPDSFSFSLYESAIFHGFLLSWNRKKLRKTLK